MRFSSPAMLLVAVFQIVLLGMITSVNSLSVSLQRLDSCTTGTIISGDNCGSLTSQCSISPSGFSKNNSDPKLCTNSSSVQQACCSTGTVPDIQPTSQPNRTCASYVVQSGDTCSAIAAANDLKVEDLATFNDKTTWGWSGCDHLSPQLKICVGKGSPPMPQSIEKAVCGPVKPGSQSPVDEKNLADLNPCPLNACCTTWSQCGTTPEFCIQENTSTTNPGTASLGYDACISNCWQASQ